jgi:hypothetical protein
MSSTTQRKFILEILIVEWHLNLLCCSVICKFSDRDWKWAFGHMPVRALDKMPLYLDQDKGRKF